ncbi:MAG: hypothetical protein M3Q95_08280 [Bacteroidota bacterium]|nr:hypothetical protein [Bacteroidota bacterium]
MKNPTIYIQREKFVFVFLFVLFLSLFTIMSLGKDLITDIEPTSTSNPVVANPVDLLSYPLHK